MLSLKGFLSAGACALIAGTYVLASYGVFQTAPPQPDPETTSAFRDMGAARPVARGGGSYRVGDPYVINGRTYVPREEPNYRAEGVASWYGDSFQGRLTANGEVFDMFALSAAHPTLPLPSYVRVTNLENNTSLVVRLNDRGPYYDDRLIDVSMKAARLLGFHEQGLTRVRVEYLGPAEIEGSDDEKLETTLRRGDTPDPMVVGSTLRTRPLDQSGNSSDEYPGLDAFGVSSERPHHTEMPGEFPAVIFD
jgi:rare lipoprotein A